MNHPNDPTPPSSRARSVQPFDELYEYADAAVYLVMSVRQVERAVASGRLRCIKQGNRVRFTKALLDEYIAACTTPPSAP